LLNGYEKEAEAKMGSESGKSLLLNPLLLPPPVPEPGPRESSSREEVEGN